ncbi:MAG: Hpt domain-containing protein [Pseudomonadota bacterium]
MAKPAQSPPDWSHGAPDMPPRAGQSAVLDLVHLTRQTFGDASLEREVLMLFVRQAKATVTALRQAKSDEERRRLFHMLKGSARGIGAFQLADMADAGEGDPASAQRLETVCDDVALIDKHIDALLGGSAAL